MASTLKMYQRVGKLEELVRVLLQQNDELRGQHNELRTIVFELKGELVPGDADVPTDFPSGPMADPRNYTTPSTVERRHTTTAPGTKGDW